MGVAIRMTVVTLSASACHCEMMAVVQLSACVGTLKVLTVMEMSRAGPPSLRLSSRCFGLVLARGSELWANVRQCGEMRRMTTMRMPEGCGMWHCLPGNMFRLVSGRWLTSQNAVLVGWILLFMFVLVESW